MPPRTVRGVIQITPRRGTMCYAFGGENGFSRSRRRMTRREFIMLLGGTAAWPLAARAQQPDRLRRIGVVEAFTENDSEGQARIGSLRERLAKLGWTNGRNVRIEYRWGAIDLNRARAYAAELAAMAPDV